MSAHSNEVVKELEQVTHRCRDMFGALSRAQLNWKPQTGSWSIAQCLDHLIRINGLYFPMLESLRSGPVPQTFWQRHSPLSRLLGRLLISSVSPENPKKVRTGRKAEPSGSEIDDDIVERFALHQAELIEHVRRIPPGIDLRGTIVTSPLLGWVTYSLDDCLTILVVHEKRHVQQAKRVMEAATFPATP